MLSQGQASSTENKPADHFFKVIHELLKEKKFKLAEKAIEVQKSQDEKSCLMKLNKLLAVSMENRKPLSLEGIELLCHQGANPACEYENADNIITMPYYTAMMRKDTRSVELFIKQPILDRYTPEQLIMLFINLSKNGWINEAEYILHRKTDIIKMCEQDDLDMVLYKISSHLIQYQFNVESLEQIRVFIKKLIEIGANPMRGIKDNPQYRTAFSMLRPWWKFLLSKVKDYDCNPKLLSITLMDIVFSNEIDKNNFVKTILFSYQAELKEYFSQNLGELNAILYYFLKYNEFDNKILDTLIELRANPLKADNNDGQNAFDLALDRAYRYATLLFVKHHFNELNDRQLSRTFCVAIDRNWDDVIEQVASSKNIKKIRMLDSLMPRFRSQLIASALRDDKLDYTFLNEACKRNDIPIDTKTSSDVLSLLDFAIYYRKSNMLESILRFNTNRITLVHFRDALEFLLHDEKIENRLNNIKFLRRIDQLFTDMEIKNQIIKNIIYDLIRDTKTIPDIFKILNKLNEELDNHSRNYVYFSGSYLYNDRPKIAEYAVRQIMHLGCYSKQIVFENENELKNVLQFLRKNSGFVLFNNYAKQFQNLTNGKIILSSKEEIAVKKTASKYSI